MKLILIVIVLAIVQLNSHPTTVSIDGVDWKVNGSITNPGAPAKGLLMNVRMVNSTFEDRTRSDFNSGLNTFKFIQRLPEYHSLGVQAITLNLQGGMPGYEGALNSAFRPDGSLRDRYLKRIKRVIDRCDELGVIVILGLFYQRQDQVLTDVEAVKRGVVNAVNWVQANEFTNVMIEIANEYGHPGFDHRIIKSPEGEVELIRLAKKTAPKLLVSTSGLGHGRIDERISQVADFILIHFNGTKVEDIPARIQALHKFDKPIVCNEDDKLGEEAARALRASVANRCSWGFMHKEQNQYQPFTFEAYNDDPIVYDAFKKAAGE